MNEAWSSRESPRWRRWRWRWWRNVVTIGSRRIITCLLLIAIVVWDYLHGIQFLHSYNDSSSITTKIVTKTIIETTIDTTTMRNVTHDHAAASTTTTSSQVKSSTNVAQQQATSILAVAVSAATTTSVNDKREDNNTSDNGRENVKQQHDDDDDDNNNNNNKRYIICLEQVYRKPSAYTIIQIANALGLAYQIAGDRGTVGLSPRYTTRYKQLFLDVVEDDGNTDTLHVNDTETETDSKSNLLFYYSKSPKTKCNRTLSGKEAQQLRPPHQVNPNLLLLLLPKSKSSSSSSLSSPSSLLLLLRPKLRVVQNEVEKIIQNIIIAGGSASSASAAATKKKTSYYVVSIQNIQAWEEHCHLQYATTTPSNNNSHGTLSSSSSGMDDFCIRSNGPPSSSVSHTIATTDDDGGSDTILRAGTQEEEEEIPPLPKVCGDTSTSTDVGAATKEPRQPPPEVIIFFYSGVEAPPYLKEMATTTTTTTTTTKARSTRIVILSLDQYPLLVQWWIMTQSDVHYGDPVSPLDHIIHHWRRGIGMIPTSCFPPIMTPSKNDNDDSELHRHDPDDDNTTNTTVLCLEGFYGRNANRIMQIASALGEVERRSQRTGRIVKLGLTPEWTVGYLNFFDPPYDNTVNNVILLNFDRSRCDSILTGQEAHYLLSSHVRNPHLVTLIPKLEIREAAERAVLERGYMVPNGTSLSSSSSSSSSSSFVSVHRRWLEGTCTTLASQPGINFCRSSDDKIVAENVCDTVYSDILQLEEKRATAIATSINSNRSVHHGPPSSNSKPNKPRVVLFTDGQKPEFDVTFPITDDHPFRVQMWMMTLSEIHYGNPLSSVDHVVNHWRQGRGMRPVQCFPPM